jgi:hypothetical protein
MGMGAPKGMAAPQAGLAAIAQPSQAPKGRTSGSMAQIMARAKDMSDGQLAEVLQGKSLDVPQYVAMTEAMGRKSLRTAMEGQQAQQQAKQPSVKDKLLMGDQPQMPPQGMPPQGMPPQGMPPQGMPQQPVMAAEGGLMYADGGAIDMNEGQGGGGIAELPAPNMMPMTMAGGGIVAFSGKDNDQQVEDEQTRRDREGTANILEAFKDYGKALGRDTLTLPGRALGGAYNTVNRGVRSLGVDSPYIPESFFSGDSSSLAPNLEAVAKRRQAKSSLPASAAAINRDADTQEGYTHGKDLNPPAPAAPPAAKLPPVVNPGAPTAGKEKTGLGATDEFKSYTDMIKKNSADYLSKLEGAGAKQREGLAKLRSQGGGEALMQLAQGLLSKGNFAQGIAAGLPGVTQTAAASRKEQRAVEQSANEYDLNLAKAQEAAAKGDMEAALKFKQLADEASYRKDAIGIQRAQLNKPDSNIALLNALGDPKLMERYKEMQAGKKGEIYSIDKAVDDFNTAMKDKFSDEAKRLKALGITNPYQYQQYVLSQGGVGGGNPFQTAANAEAQKRGI